MGDEGQIKQVRLRALTPAMVEHIDRKVAEGIELRFAIIKIVIEKGMPRWIRGPAPSEKLGLYDA